MNFVKKPRREPMQLQLTAMIDIFSMIVIFLVLGTVVSGSEVELPANFMLPQSWSKETAATAPRLVITADKVDVSDLGISFPIKMMEESTPENFASIEKIREKIRNYVQRKPASTATSPGRMLNIVADERLPYSKLYDVLAIFREAGFETLLFVTVTKKDDK